MERIDDSIRFLDETVLADQRKLWQKRHIVFGIQIALMQDVAPCSTLLRHTAVMPRLSQMPRPNDDATVNLRGLLPIQEVFQEASDWPFVLKGRLVRGGL